MVTIFLIAFLLCYISCENSHSNITDMKTFYCEITNDTTVIENGVSRTMTDEEIQKLHSYEIQMNEYEALISSLWYKIKVFFNSIFFGLWPKLPRLPELPEVPCFCPHICGDNIINATTHHVKIRSAKISNE